MAIKFCESFFRKIGGRVALLHGKSEQSAKVFSMKIVFFTKSRLFSPSKVSRYTVSVAVLRPRSIFVTFPHLKWVITELLLRMELAFGKLISCIYKERMSPEGKWKTLKRKPKYGNGSTETEVRKQKYGSEKKSHLSVHECAL